MSSKVKRAGITTTKGSRYARNLRKAAPAGKVRIFGVSEGAPRVFYDEKILPSKSGKAPLKKFEPSLTRAMSSAARLGKGVDVIVVRRGEEWPGSIGVEVGPSMPSSRRKSYLPGAESGVATDALIDRMLPDAPVPTPAQALQAQRNSEARWGLMQEFGAYTSEEIADHRSRAKNRHALANRWRGEGKVFAIEFQGQRLYPGFQFDPETFAPEPVVSEVLRALPREEMSDWEAALWWTAANGWLAGARPVDLMRKDDDAVVAAAAHLAEPSPL